jgi:hypothetical protein
MQVARARVSQTGKLSDFATPTFQALGTVQSTLGVGGCGREIFASATCSLQFAKASAATLPQQEKNNTALSVQWQVSPRGDGPSTSSGRWP